MMKDKNTKKHTKEASTLDEETFGYFKRVEDVMNEDDFEDEESRTLFVSNVFLQLENNEMKLFCDQIISRTIEKLVFFLNDVQIRQVMHNVEDYFIKIAMDKYGSHVLQSLICAVPGAIRSERRTVKEEMKDLKSAEELFLNLCDCLKENLNELVGHVYGSHVVRTALEILGGVKVADSVVRSRASRISRERSHQAEESKHFIKLNQVGNPFRSSVLKPTETMAVPESFPPILKQLTKVILKMELVKLALHPVSNPLVQTLLLVLHKKNSSLCMKLSKAVMSQIDMLSRRKDSVRGERQSDVDDDDDNDDDDDDDDDDNNNRSKKDQSYRVPVIFSNEISSHLVEKILHVVSPRIWQELFENYFRAHLAQLSQHPISNFIVQHLMASTAEQSQAKEIVAELLPYLEDILALGHMGVVVRIVELAIRFSVKQRKILKGILRAFHCKQKDQQTTSSVVLILSLTTYEVFFGTKTEENECVEVKNGPEPKLKSVNFHGALLLKTLLEFQDPSALVESFLGLSLEELMIIATDQMGSYATEAFLKSKAVPTERKHDLIKKLEGTFSKLACEKQGSHVVETCWRHAGVKYKELINKELAQNEQHLNGNFYGRIVLRNCGVEHFKRKDASWHEREQRVAKKKKMLEEIFEEREESVHHRKVKPVERNPFAKLAPEMAALGFTAGGKRSADDNIDDEIDFRGLNKGNATDVLLSKGKKKRISQMDNNTETENVLGEDSLEFIASAVEASKANKKSKKGKGKKKQ